MVSALLDEKIAKEELSVGWPWRFFLFSVLIASTSAVVAVGLSFGYKPFLQSRLNQQQSNLEALGKVVPQAQQEEFVNFYSQLTNLQSVLARHVTVSPLFGFIESRTNTAVSYVTMEARVPDRKVVLEGSASNYAIFSQQLQAFSASPEVTGVIVNNSSALDGKVKFRLTLTVRPSVFGAVPNSQ